MTSTKIDSLPKLIERLRDPQGHSRLYLDDESLESITAYRGVDDFAEVFTDFLCAIKENVTVTVLEARLFCKHGTKKKMFPILNPLLRHLPRADTVILHVQAEAQSHSWFLFEDSLSFKTVRIEQHVFHKPEYADGFVVEIHLDWETFEYTSLECECVNGVVGPMLLSLPLPSKLRELALAGEDGELWDSEVTRPFTDLELNRLVEIMQASSLAKLTLQNIRFASMEDSNQFARGLAASRAKDLRLHLFTPDTGNYREIVSALSEMPQLESLDAIFTLDQWGTDSETVGSFSINVGDIVRGTPGMKSLKIVQGWKHWDDLQCRDLAMAVQAPSCALKVLDISSGMYNFFGKSGVSGSTLAGAAAVMSVFSAPPSSIEEFTVTISFEDNEDFDVWLSMLPRTTALRSIQLDAEFTGNLIALLTELQQKRFVDIVSGWFYLTDVCGEFKGFFEYCLGEDSRQQLCTIMRLNKAGRHYLILPTRSKADGVEVLVKVRDELNDLYTHLLENPCLCDRGVNTPARASAHGVNASASVLDEASTDDAVRPAVVSFNGLDIQVLASEGRAATRKSVESLSDSSEASYWTAVQDFQPLEAARSVSSDTEPAFMPTDHGHSTIEEDYFDPGATTK